MHGRDIERLSYLEAALKDLTAIVQKTIKDPKMGTKKAKGSAVLMKPLRLALTAKKVSDGELYKQLKQPVESLLPSP